jgi:site-specific DNA recombinase
VHSRNGNPKYVGEFTFGTRKWQRHPTIRKRVTRVSDDVEVLRELCVDLAIIDRGTWDAVQARLTEHAKNYNARAIPHIDRPQSLLTGLLKCGCCDGFMQISGGSPLLPLRLKSKARRLREPPECPREPHARTPP